jgi:hypothetical protein
MPHLIDVQYKLFPGGSPKRFGFYLEKNEKQARAEALKLLRALRKGEAYYGDEDFGSGGGCRRPNAAVFVDGIKIEDEGEDEG